MANADDIKDVPISEYLKLANPLEQQKRIAKHGFRTAVETIPGALGTASGYLRSPLLRKELISKTGKSLKGVGEALTKRAKPEAARLMEELGLGQFAPTLDREKIEGLPADPSQTDVSQRKGKGSFFEQEKGQEAQGVGSNRITELEGFRDQLASRMKAYDSAAMEANEVRQEAIVESRSQEQQMADEDEAFLRINKDDYERMKRVGLEQKDFWTDAKMPTKIAAGIGLVLTSTLKNNTPYMALSGLINRESERQSAQFERTKDILSGSNTIFANQMKLHGDRRIALHNTRAAIFESTKESMQAKVQGISNTVAISNATNAIAQLENDAQKNWLAGLKFQRELRGGELKAMSAESATKFGISLSSLEDIKNTQDKLGTIDWNILGVSERKQVVNALTEALARGLSGAAIPPEEWKRFMQWVPKYTDSQEETDMKLTRLTSIFSSTVAAMDPSGGLRRQISREREGTISERVSGTAGGPSLGFTAGK